jgi:thioredoxin-dependent peroxiredoxin
MALSIGDTAPAFSLHTQTGDAPITLSDYQGKYVVLYFYPKDDTPGCTKESCAFRDLNAAFDEVNAVIFGVSLDDADSHAKFATKFSLNFPLLADSDKSVSLAYEVYKEKKNYGKTYMGIERTTFVIAPDGKIAKVYPRVSVDGHADAVLAFIQSL